jgi:hypothetical protein
VDACVGRLFQQAAQFAGVVRAHRAGASVDSTRKI